VTRLLFIADLVGSQARDWLCDGIAELRRETRADVVVVNADNVAVTGARPMGGSGMTAEDVDRLSEAGIDVISCGSHAFDAPAHDLALGHERVVRPANLSVDKPGRGWIRLQAGDRPPVTLLHLAGASSRLPVGLPSIPEAIAGDRPVVHFVGSPFETGVFAHALDGRVTVVLGTLGHARTSGPRRLPRRTVLLEDVGYTGPVGGIGGFDAAHFVADLFGEAPPPEPYRLVDGPLRLQAAIVEVDEKGDADVELVERMA
jgi:calcineurin-like phosphoesterase